MTDINRTTFSGDENNNNNIQQQPQELPQQRRKRRWGEAPVVSQQQDASGSSGSSISIQQQQQAATATTTTNTNNNASGNNVNDARARVLALQESVKAKLAAAKAAGSSTTSSVSSSTIVVGLHEQGTNRTMIPNNTDTTASDARARVLALQESVKARLAAAKAGQQQQQQQHVPATTTTTSTGLLNRNNDKLSQQQQQPVTKKARIYELDMTVTAPTFKQQHDGIVQQPPTGIMSTTKKGGGKRTDVSTAIISSKENSSIVKKEVVVPSNPYLAHLTTDVHNKSDSYTADKWQKKKKNSIGTSVDDSSLTTDGLMNDQQNDTQPPVDLDDTMSYDTRLVRVEKKRTRQKSFHFTEPGTWEERGNRLRMKQLKINESGYLSGRKKGHSILSAAASIISTTTGEIGDDFKEGMVDTNPDDIANSMIGSSHKNNTDGYYTLYNLPSRYDTNPDTIMGMPTIVEWWDIEYLPSTIRKQIAVLEQEKDNASIMVPRKTGSKTTTTTTTKQQGNVPKQESGEDQKEKNDDDNDGNIDDENNMDIEPTIESSNSMKDGDKLDDDEEGKYHPLAENVLIRELRKVCSEQGALVNSRTAELVQHIVPIKPKLIVPPGMESSKLVKQYENNSNNTQLVLHLTKKEMRRQRKLRRQEKQRELQDLQAAGILPAPEPKLTLRNFFQVLGDVAVTDPSQMEAMVQKEIHARQEKHLERNMQQQLTKEQISIKKINKLQQQDTVASLTQQVTIALFYVRDMSHPYHRTKVDLNAQQMNITGTVLECTNNHNLHSEHVCGTSPFACVIAEGNQKSMKRFVRLMTVRMKWTGTDDDDDDDDDDDEEVVTAGTTADGEVPVKVKKEKFNSTNFCSLLWEGISMKRHFHGFLFQDCDTIQQGRKLLKTRGVEQYWDQIIEYHSQQNETHHHPNDNVVVKFKIV